METKGRTNAERGKNVWLLETREGKLVDSFRTKVMAEYYKDYYQKQYDWDLTIRRKKFEVTNEQKKDMS